MADFAQDISNFQRYGTYIYKFDNVGNMIFDSSSADFSQVYLAFPLKNSFYNKSKVVTFYDPTFTEFVPTSTTTGSIAQLDTEVLQQQLVDAQQTNVQLQQKLDSVVSENAITGSAMNDLAVKQVILELRKFLGQGRVESDFSDTFPYTAIKKPTA